MSCFTFYRADIYLASKWVGYCARGFTLIPACENRLLPRTRSNEYFGGETENRKSILLPCRSQHRPIYVRDVAVKHNIIYPAALSICENGHSCINGQKAFSPDQYFNLLLFIVTIYQDLIKTFILLLQLTEREQNEWNWKSTQRNFATKFHSLFVSSVDCTIKLLAEISVCQNWVSDRRSLNQTGRMKLFLFPDIIHVKKLDAALQNLESKTHPRRRESSEVTDRINPTRIRDWNKCSIMLYVEECMSYFWARMVDSIILRWLDKQSLQRSISNTFLSFSQLFSQLD